MSDLRKKCWEFIRRGSEWLSLDDVLIEYGLSGLEEADESATICLETERVLTWKEAKELLLKLVEKLR